MKSKFILFSPWLLKSPDPQTLNQRSWLQESVLDLQEWIEAVAPGLRFLLCCDGVPKTKHGVPLKGSITGV